MTRTAPIGARQLVSFFLGPEEYGVDLLAVQEIVHLADIARVPSAPPHVEGVVNLRGRIVPVVDLRKMLGLADTASTRRTRIIIVGVGGRTVGLIVDGVREVLRIEDEAIEPPPEMATSAGAGAYIAGVGKLDGRLLILLELDRLLGEGAFTLT